MEHTRQILVHVGKLKRLSVEGRIKNHIFFAFCANVMFFLVRVGSSCPIAATPRCVNLVGQLHRVGFWIVRTNAIFGGNDAISGLSASRVHIFAWTVNHVMFKMTLSSSHGILDRDHVILDRDHVNWRWDHVIQGRDDLDFTWPEPKSPEIRVVVDYF